MVSVTTLLSKAERGDIGNQASYQTDLSFGGDFVVFTSEATNLGPPDGDDFSDVYVKTLESQEVERISVPADGTDTVDGNSSSPEITASGRIVAFQSTACNLVADMTPCPANINDRHDNVFLHDRHTSTTWLASRGLNGAAANGSSVGPTLPGWYEYDSDPHTGRLTVVQLAFASDASNLVPGDANGATDVFLYTYTDQSPGVPATETITLISRSGAGQGLEASWDPHFSDNGDYVAFTSSAENLVPNDGNGVDDVFRLRVGSDNLIRVSETLPLSSDNPGSLTPEGGNGRSYDPAISPNGDYVAFATEATNLVGLLSEDDESPDRHSNILLKDIDSDTLELVTIAPDGTAADGASSSPRIWTDAAVVEAGDIYEEIEAPARTLVVFTSAATNLLVPLDSRDRDTNGVPDIYLRDVTNGITERVSINSQGQEADEESRRASIGAGGQLVVYESDATNLAGVTDHFNSDIFLTDRNACGPNVKEEGPLSGRIDEAEQALRVTKPAVHTTNCQIVVPAERRLPPLEDRLPPLDS